jgi:hypothetical protein
MRTLIVIIALLFTLPARIWAGADGESVQAQFYCFTAPIVSNSLPLRHDVQVGGVSIAASFFDQLADGNAFQPGSPAQGANPFGDRRGIPPATIRRWNRLCNGHAMLRNGDLFPLRHALLQRENYTSPSGDLSNSSSGSMCTSTLATRSTSARTRFSTSWEIVWPARTLRFPPTTTCSST